MGPIDFINCSTALGFHSLIPALIIYFQYSFALCFRLLETTIFAIIIKYVI